MADRTGQQLGNYRVVRLLGQGGFAEVYLGEHIYLKTQVAIKLLKTTVAHQEDLDSFLKEAQTIARLVHPHIIRVMDFGVDQETPFLVMDYAPNGTLRQKHPRGSMLPLTTIVPYVKQLAFALEHAHAEKLIHRDIKPENILVGRAQEVLLSDFGIALIAQSSRYQSTQDVVGTVAYMSPEQIQGKPRPASDQYSLGIVVYEWLSGVRPFHGSFTELCTQHMFASPPPLHEKLPTLPPPVEEVVMTALAKEPKQRFGSVQAFATALEEASQSKRQNTLLAPASLDTPTPQILKATSPLSSTQDMGSASPPAAPLAQSFTQPAENPLLQETGPSSNEEKKINLWKVGKRELIAMAIGVVLFVSVFGLSFLFGGGFVIGGNFIILAFVIPVFFGAVFGPWVGLVTGGAGALFFTLISAFLSILPPNVFETYIASLNSYIKFNTASSIWGFATIGFVGGLAFLLTKGRYHSWPPIAVATGFSIIASIAGGIALILSQSRMDPFIFALSTAFNLILLPFFLFLYIRISSSERDLWRIGKRQFMAMGAGVAIFVISLFVISLYFTSHSDYDPLLIAAFAFVIPLFFGAIFGPWVGSVTGGAGMVLYTILPPYNFNIWIYQIINSYNQYYNEYYLNRNDYLYSIIHPYNAISSWVFQCALIGFITGLAILKTRGRYNTWRKVAVAVRYGLVGSLLSFGLFIIIGFLTESAGLLLTIDYIPVFSVFNLIPLPLFLFLYDKIFYRKQAV